MDWNFFLANSWHTLTALFAVLDLVATVVTITWVLMTKKEATSAVAWCLLAVFLPLIGAVLFLLFGHQHVSRPLNRKRRHTKRFRQKHPERLASDGWAEGQTSPPLVPSHAPSSSPPALSNLAQRFGAFPPTPGNHVHLYHEGSPAFEAMLAEMSRAHHHIHAEFYIYQPDEIGRRFLQVLIDKARSGVEVRLLYDAIGTRKFMRLPWQELQKAGGQFKQFLPINPLRRSYQINLRNHRKILVVDGQVAFTGGMNVGDEYLGRVPQFGYWRDTQLRIEGPAVADLQRIFTEDWDFAAGEDLEETAYYPSTRQDGMTTVQVVESGPDRETKAIREVFFATILEARQRLWIASPYFVPDAGLLDALCLAAQRGVDVRLLCLYHPDKWIPFLAGRYYWTDLLRAGGKVYQYTRGMMHAKVVTVDGNWAMVGTANLDNRSMHLNFEVNCLLYDPGLTAELDAAFLRDFRSAIRLDRHVFGQRPFAARLMENTCRLLSPIL